MEERVKTLGGFLILKIYSIANFERILLGPFHQVLSSFISEE